MASEFQNLIKTKSIGAITPQQILAAGENIFLDIQASADINSINKAIQAYARIHSPNYGQPIANSGSITSVAGSETLLSPSESEVRRILSISAVNGGGAPIVGTVKLGSIVIAAFAIDPASTGVIDIPNNLFIDKNLPLSVAVSSGTASELTSSVASILVFQ